MKCLVATLAVLGLAMPVAAAAKDLDRSKFEKRSERQFKQADLNSNGSLDNAEVKAMLVAKEVKRATRKETDPREVKPRKVKRMVEALDTNTDGMIDRAEFMAERTAWFDGKDADSDGVLTKDERKGR